MTTSENTRKTCFKCGAEKPIADFYRHKQMADGHLNKCKACTKSDSYKRRHFSDKREAILAYDRKRGNRQGADYRKAYRDGQSQKYKAHSMLSNAVRSGKITRPTKCSHCNKNCKPHGHHEDYRKPLEVVWLCVQCHRNLHAMYETIGRKIPA